MFCFVSILTCTVTSRIYKRAYGEVISEIIEYRRKEETLLYYVTMINTNY